MKCIGFGEFEGNCQNNAGGEMLPKSHHWCDRCEKLRRKHITKQMEGLLKDDANREMLDEDADYFEAAGIDDIGCK